MVDELAALIVFLVLAILTAFGQHHTWEAPIVPHWTCILGIRGSIDWNAYDPARGGIIPPRY